MRGIAKKVTVAAMASLLLSGCAMYSLQQLRQTTPKGSPFQNALARMYMDFATQEEKEYDWFNSWHFADKGLMLAYGRDMAPEDLADWDIPAAELPYLQKAREALMAVLTPENEKGNPDVAAKAQYNFDCWVEQQEEDWQEDDIAACRDGLREALAELNAPPVALTSAEEQRMSTQQAIDKETLPAKKAKPVKKAKAKKAAPVKPKAEAKKAEKAEGGAAAEPETTSYVVFFEVNTAELSVSGKKVIEDIGHALQGVKDYDVIINGNTSMAGDADANRQLMQARIETVKRALEDAGIPISVISTGGTKQEASRRVEIFLNE